MEASEGYYFQMLEAGAKPEEARSILPNSLKTEIVVTMDLREMETFYPAAGRTCRPSADPGNHETDSGRVFKTVSGIFQ